MPGDQPARPTRLRKKDLNPDDDIPTFCCGDFADRVRGIGGRVELGAVCGRGRFRRVVRGRVDGIFKVGAGGEAGMTVGRTGGS